MHTLSFSEHARASSEMCENNPTLGWRFLGSPNTKSCSSYDFERQVAWRRTRAAISIAQPCVLSQPAWALEGCVEMKGDWVSEWVCEWVSGCGEVRWGERVSDWVVEWVGEWGLVVISTPVKYCHYVRPNRNPSASHEYHLLIFLIWWCLCVHHWLKILAMILHRAIEITIRTRSCGGQVKHQCITCQAINKGLRLRETLCDNADKLFGVHG